MKKLFKNFLIIAILIGCSSVCQQKLTLPNVDPELRQYVLEFNTYYRKYRGKHIPNSTKVIFGELDSPNAAGVYNRITHTTTLSIKHWEKSSEYRREHHVFHELGHHILRLNHTSGPNQWFSDGCPKSMMYWQTMSNKCYKYRRDYYIQELFQRDKAAWADL